MRETLAYVAEHASDVVDSSRKADAELARWSREGSPDIGIRGRIVSDPREEEVLVETVVPGDAGTRAEAGLPKGLWRTGVVRPVRMPVLDRFEPALTRKVPLGYVLREDAAAALAPLLALHGIEIERLADTAATVVQPFVVQGWDSGPRFQNHLETTLRGRYEAEKSRQLPAGTAVVWTSQPRGLLAVYLLEPESDDGAVTWNFVDRLLLRDSEFPIVRIVRREAR